MFTLQRYAYRGWHTLLPLTPAGVWHFYDGRAGMEPRIRELRDYATGEIPTRAFAADALYLEGVRLAYNLVTAFQRACLPKEWQGMTLSRLRRAFWATVQQLDVPFYLRHKLFWVPGETYPSSTPTYSAVSEFTPHPQARRGDTPSDLQVKPVGK